ncbi:MAG: DUF3052 family protein [Gemmatimonadota bacterium]
MTAAPGYSGTPLAKKLGIREGTRLLLVNAPDGYNAVLEPLPPEVVVEERAGPAVDVAQVFVTQKDELAKQLGKFRKALRSDAALWISWPKKASKVPTTVTEDVIREVALPLGLVDVKVCAVTDVWSGLKLVVRKELR